MRWVILLVSVLVLGVTARAWPFTAGPARLIGMEMVIREAY